MKKTKQFKPRYSGDKSKKFWKAVNSLSDEEQSAMYASGVLLQNMESTILAWLNNNIAFEKELKINTKVPIEVPSKITETKKGYRYYTKLRNKINEIIAYLEDN